MANLTTLTKVKSFLGITNTNDDDLLEDIFIPTASNMVEGYCKRIFGTLNGTLTMDYAHLLNESAEKFDCQCGANNCRKLIKGNNDILEKKISMATHPK